LTDQGEPPDDPKTGPEAVKATISGKRKLTVIEGGKGEPKRSRSRKAKASAEAEAPEEEAFDPSAASGASPEPDEDREDLADTSDDDGLPPDGLDEAIIEIVRFCKDLDQNDRDNGRRLVAHFGDEFWYVTGLGWLIWRGTHWERDEGDLCIRLLAQQLVDRMKLEPALIEANAAQQRLLDLAEKYRKVAAEKRTAEQADVIGRAMELKKAISARRSKRRAFAVTSGNAGRTSAMLQQAMSLKATAAKLLDADHYRFNTRSGTLVFSRHPDPEQDLDGDDVKVRYVGHVELRPHNRDDLITKLADVDYDPDATCPEFQKFLDRMQPENTTQPGNAMQLFLQVATAYTMLIGGNGAQKVFYHFGTGGNGKSAFLEAIGGVAGTYRTTVSPDTITGDAQRQGQQASPDIARLFNTRLVLVEELPKNTPLREDLVKAFSGGGRMTARFLQKDIFEFQPIFVAVLSGNTKPTITGADNGIWRRVLIVPWEQTIKEDDPDRVEFPELLARFQAERSGILNWLIEGALLYLKHGLMHFVPAKVRSFTEEYRRERDNVEVFCNVMIVRETGKRVQAGVLFKSYTDWCEANGLRAATQRSFGDRLSTLGFEKKTGGLYYYLDVVLRDNPKYDPADTAPPIDSLDPGWSPPR